MPILLLDLWLLAYPHVAATYSRIAFDFDSAKKNAYLLTIVPTIVFAITALTGLVGGILWLNTLYFFWQTWHYTRQSYGISRTYCRMATKSTDIVTDCLVYIFPLWGLVHRSTQQHSTFYASPVWLPPLPHYSTIIVGAVSILCFLIWTIKQFQKRDTDSSLPHILFVLSHILITLTSYVLISDITQGWLFINIWHNAQYLLFVWAINHRDAFKQSNQTTGKLHTLTKGIFPFLAFCTLSGGLFYFLMGQAVQLIQTELIPIVLVAHLTVNFHHYWVDAVIWTSRRARGTAVEPATIPP